MVKRQEARQKRYYHHLLNTDPDNAAKAKLGRVSEGLIVC